MTSYAKRQEARKQLEANKEREREMKEEKEAEHQVCFNKQSFIALHTHFQHDTLLCLFLCHACLNYLLPGSSSHLLTVAFYMVTNNSFPTQAHIQRIKDKRAAKEEKARYEKMAEKMHAKRVERLKRREKRNKLLNS